jgi:L-iditol 2-dehydrogenase
VLVKVGADTICGTDVRIVRGEKTSGVRLPVVLGHETAGHVAEVGCLFVAHTDLPSEQLALAEPLACVVNGQRWSPVEVDDTVLVVDAGPIGLLHLQLALGSGARAVIVVELARVGGRVNLFAGFKGKGLAEVESNLLHYKQVRLTGTPTLAAQTTRPPCA